MVQHRTMKQELIFFEGTVVPQDVGESAEVVELAPQQRELARSA